MRKIISEVIINSLSLYLISQVISGLTIQGGLQTFLIAGLFILLGDYVLKPIFNLISLPFNVLTLGLFSSLTNALALYVITLIFPKIVVTSFYFPGFSFRTFSIPAFFVIKALSYLLISFIIQVIKRTFFWLIER